MNLMECVQNEGIELRKTGQNYKALCPFHDDHHPSFYVYPDANRFICFGCGLKGDAIDFIRKLRNLKFKEAISYLGIADSCKVSHKDLTRRTQKRVLIQSFREWCNDYYDEISTEYRCINKVISTFKFIDECEKYTSLYHRLPVLEYHMDVIIHGNDEERFNLYREIES